MSYRRRFPPTQDEDQTIDGYLRPREYVDPDEDELNERVVQMFLASTRKVKPGVGKDDPAFHEQHWGHTSGLIRGTLEIDRIEALPERFRVGLFSNAGSYPVIGRPNALVDNVAKFSTMRFGIKVRYSEPVPNVYAASGTAHELDLMLCEGSPEVNGPNHSFAFRDSHEMTMFETLAPPSLRTLGTLANPDNWGVIRRLAKRAAGGTGFTKGAHARSTGWAGKTFFSLGPFALGEGAMKLCAKPRQRQPIKPIDVRNESWTARHREAMVAWLEAGEDAVFDLCVQLATPEAIPEPGPGDPSKSVMTAEYCDLQWDEVASPYVPVGTLTFRASPDSDLTTEYPYSPLQYNAWNTFESMRPLGQLFRARKGTHKAHSDLRLVRIYRAEPGAMVDRAPFEPGG